MHSVERTEALKGMFAGAIITRPNGDAEGIYYGSILGRVRYNPSRGIVFRFKDSEGIWEVSITGHDLGDMHRDLNLQRGEAIHTGEQVTAIDIKAWQPAKEKK